MGTPGGAADDWIPAAIGVNVADGVFLPGGWLDPLPMMDTSGRDCETPLANSNALAGGAPAATEPADIDAAVPEGGLVRPRAEVEADREAPGRLSLDLWRLAAG